MNTAAQIGQGAVLTAGQRLTQRQALSQQQLRGLELLMKPLPELRAEIVAEIAANPVLEDIDHPLETPLSAVDAASARDDEPDYPVEDFEPGSNADEDVAERRQRLFDSMVAPSETLEHHLMAQLELENLLPSERLAAELLIADLDDDGRAPDNTATIQMVTGLDARAVERVRARLMALDPPGCAARTLAECLLAQLARLPVSPEKALARRLVESHLGDVAAGRLDAVARALGTDARGVAEALRLVRTLEPRPGRQYPGLKERVEYVNPEVHAVCRDGWWEAVTDKRSLPEICVSRKYLDMLEDPKADPETKRYVKERIAAAEALRQAVAKRQNTLHDVAQCLFDRQQDFFDQGFAALKPLTEAEVADAVGLSVATVSRTVRGKYAATPRGTIELRQLLAAGAKGADGEGTSQQAVLAVLRKIVEAEDPSAPLSDEKLAQALSATGFKVARRTVAKYRDLAGIPSAADRRRHA